MIATATSENRIENNMISLFQGSRDDHRRLDKKILNEHCESQRMSKRQVMTLRQCIQTVLIHLLVCSPRYVVSFQPSLSPFISTLSKRDYYLETHFLKKTTNLEENSRESKKRKWIWWRRRDWKEATADVGATMNKTNYKTNFLTSTNDTEASLFIALPFNSTVQAINDSVTQNEENYDFESDHSKMDNETIQLFERPATSEENNTKGIEYPNSPLEKTNNKRRRNVPFFFRGPKQLKDGIVRPLPPLTPKPPLIGKKPATGFSGNALKVQEKKGGGILPFIRRATLASFTVAAIAYGFIVYPIVDRMLQDWITSSASGLLQIHQRNLPQIEESIASSRLSEDSSTSIRSETLVPMWGASVLSFVKHAVQKVGPSVLRIDTETHMQEEMVTPHPPAWIQQGQGSGFIFSSDGLILTNAHVVEDATKVSVTLTDGRIFKAEVKGTDEIVDIAVLKIVSGERDNASLKNLPVAELGDSDELEVGQIVIAVGTPGGLDNTVTMGIVSGLERSSTVVGIPHKKVDYIQTDAAINLGNSGGPLVDVETGKVIGINACIRANMEGTSFAIPINRVREIIADLSEGKHVHHGYLGISMSTCTPEYARQWNEDNKKSPIAEVQGSVITRVFPRTPAQLGGLQEGDVVIEIGGKKVTSSDDARRLIDSAAVGNELTVIVLRNQQQRVALTLHPVDLATRLKEIRRERERQEHQDRIQMQDLAPFRSILR